MTRKRLLVLGVAAVAVGAAAVGGFAWWSGRQGQQSTENAYVRADTVSVSSRVAGYVAEVLVEDNQAVRPGQVLLRLDASDAEAALAQAEAQVSAAAAGARNVDDQSSLEGAVIAERSAAVASAEAEARRASLELARYASLASRGFVSEQRMQNLRAAAAASQAAVAQARAGVQAERLRSSSLGSTRDQALAEAERARAAAARARLDLGRAVVTAPEGGVIGARSVRPGQYVQAGAPLMAIVPLGRTYVVANFKETQVGAMRVGQPVEIEADAFPGHPIHGRVESFAPATGSEFAMIPVENATGNFTKVVQRVPVRIAVDGGDPLSGGLRPGLSVKVKVDTNARGQAGFADVGAPRTTQASAR